MSKPFCIERGPVLIIPDLQNQNMYQIRRNPEYTDVPDICAFSDFIRWNFGDAYERLIRKKLTEGSIPLDDRSEYQRSKIAGVDVNAINIHKVLFHAINKLTLRVDTVIVADYTVHYSEGYVSKERQWYRVQGTYHANRSADLFESVSVYNKMDIPNVNTLSDYLIPFLTNADLDGVVESLLHEYYPEALSNPLRIDMKELAKRMGFEVQTVRLSLDDSKFAAIIFEPTEITFFKNGNKRRAAARGNLILIDPAAHQNRRKNINDSIAHELIHAYVHFLFYHGQAMYRAMLEIELAEFEDMVQENTEPISWIESQAIHMTPRLRMPLSQAAVFAEKLFQQYTQESEESTFEAVISALSSFYDVSLEAARNRLVELGYHKARGIRQFANGKIVPGYLVSRKVACNLVFTIDFRRLVEEYSRNESLRSMLDNGAFIYVEGHLCRNHPKYVLAQNSKLSLTPYARTHMDECCLVFTIQQSAEYYEYTPGTLNREMKRGELSYLYTQTTGTPIAEAGAISKIRLEMPTDFGSTIKYHMHNLALTRETLAERSLLSVNTISRMRQTQTRKVKLQSVLAVSVGMQLYPELCQDLLDKADLVLHDDVAEELFYKVMMRTMYRESIYAWNEMLEAEGFPPLKEDLLADDRT